MWVYRTTGVITAILQVPLALITWLTTLIGGLIAGIPLLGLLYILLVTTVWQVFLWPLILGAWLWMRLPGWLSWPIGIIGIPLVIMGDVFLKLTGALSADPEDRIGHLTKQSICQQWPYPFTLEADGKPVLRALQEENGYSFVRAVIELNDSLIRRQLGIA